MCTEISAKVRGKARLGGLANAPLESGRTCQRRANAPCGATFVAAAFVVVLVTITLTWQMSLLRANVGFANL